MNYFVRFHQEDAGQTAKTVFVPSGMFLTVAALEAGFSLQTVCGGGGTCGKCQLIVNGEKHLACQTTVENDLDVVIPAATLQKNNDKSVVIQTQSFLNNVNVTGSTGWAENAKHTENIRYTRRAGHRFGVCVDIGTTTLAAELHHFQEPSVVWTVSRANPQRIFGDDVMTRIQKVIEEPVMLAKLQRSIVEAVNGMLEELAATANIPVTEISLLVVAGNTVMEHIFLGIDPSPLGFAPFTAPVSRYPVCSGSDIGIQMATQGIIETLPIFGGFVGGDIVAGVLATGIFSEQHSPKFLLDIGTNGELVLCSGGEIDTAATAAGPAFEGGRIEHGTLAVSGAIDKIELSPSTLNISTIANQPPIGICGSGLIDIVSELLRHRLIKPSGQFNVKADSEFLPYWKIIDGKPNFELVTPEKSGIGESILLTQRDVRQFQLAIGAIRAGIRLLLLRRGLQPEDIETFYVAGGFGSFIRPVAALRIGLIPQEIPLERIRFCGNTSLAGARLTLLDPNYRNKTQRLTQHAHHIELAALPNFANVYTDSMIFCTENNIYCQ
jgi:uncharacterized 2Fe-2S/4Fe-4S cluster protein (DUF4445 family)